MKAGKILFVCVGMWTVGCTNEPTRRSAVDLAKLCSEKGQAVTQGGCLPTGQAVIAGSGIPTPAETPNGNPALPPVVDKKVPPATSADAGAAAPPTSPVVAQREAAAKAIDSVADQLGKTSGVPPAAGPERTASIATEPTATVTFDKDTFIAIADASVTKNCFIPMGTEMEVKGIPVKVTQFTSLGVDQAVTGETISVKYPKSQSDACGLVGRDFVYLSTHAKVAEKK